MVHGEKADKVGAWIVKILFVCTILFIYLPIVVAIILSFDPRGYLATFPPTGVSLRWYAFFFSYGSFMSGLKVSVILGVSTVIVSTLVGIPAALALVRHPFLGKELLSTLMTSPIVVPGVVSGVALVTFLMGFLRFYDSFTNLLIAHTIITFPYQLRTVSAALVGFDRALEEAAMNLGANELQTFFKVTLPIIKPAVIAGAIFAFSISFDNVSLSVFLTDPFTTTFPITLLGYLRNKIDPGIAAASVVLMIFTLLLVMAIDRLVGIDKFTGLERTTV